MKRKRKRAPKGPADRNSKRVKLNCATTTSTTTTTTTALPPLAHPVLSSYYPRIVSLRTYLLELLPSSSKSRRRKIASVGTRQPRKKANKEHCAAKDEDEDDDCVTGLAQLLDSTLVGVAKPPDNALNRSRQREFAAFTQSLSQARSSAATGGTDTGAACPQSEIVDFAILSLFSRRQHTPFHRPQHILCHGFQRATNQCLSNQEHGPMAAIPGIVSQYPNKSVSLLKNFPWPDVLGLLGKNGEELMLHLLLDCGLFIKLQNGRGPFYQLSGTPLVDLPLLGRRDTSLQDVTKYDGKKPSHQKQELNTPGTIMFVRQDMFYARAALNAKGHVRLGLRHIPGRKLDVLNRYPDSTNLDHTVHIIKYIFPRQFGLHNVFTSAVDRKETVRPFKDYTLREDEIGRRENYRRQCATNPSSHNSNKLPKRLRGNLVSLIQKLQKRHKRCAYVELLRHYCPAEKEVPTTKCSMVEFATPPAAVSAFCRAVLLNLVPNELYGHCENGKLNRDSILRSVDTFVHLGRFENLSLHEVSQGLKITCIKWLQPAGTVEQDQSNLAASDLRKRTEIFLEFVYYLFDSLLIPLIRSNFYVTETGVHRNRVFYFRHDIWRKLAEPSIAQLKHTVLEEVKRDRAERMLANRSSSSALGFSRLRLVPKATGARPIVNLRKRPVKKIARRGGRGTELGPSINSLMAPVQSVLNYERNLQPETVGSAISSVPEIHERLSNFKETLVERKAMGTKPLYFVKLDVQSCFDTIPHARLLQLVEQLVCDDEYRITKHAKVTPPGQVNRNKPRRQFVSRAAAFGDLATPFDEVARDLADPLIQRKRKPNNNANTVFVDIGAQKRHDTGRLLDLLEQHVRNNLVRIGKKYYRQRSGIPQGSVVSALLCNLFYGAHEAAELGFLSACDETVLLRLVDDYLLVTTDKGLALRFLQVMLDGNPEYGISVGADKTLVNFEATVNGQRITRLPPSQFCFPYCGTLIDTRTLAISRDGQHHHHGDDSRVSDRLTVETSRNPGNTFHRKTLAAFRLNLHAMFLDTHHNSTPVVMRNLYHTFLDTAIKTYTYHRKLLLQPGKRKSPQQPQRGRNGRTQPSKESSELLMRIILDLIRLAIYIVQARRTVPATTTTAESSSSFSSSTITPAQIRWLAAMAFKLVLSRKQTGFADTLRWLESVMKTSRPRTDREAAKLWGVVRGAGKAVQKMKF